MNHLYHLSHCCDKIFAWIGQTDLFVSEIFHSEDAMPRSLISSTLTSNHLGLLLIILAIVTSGCSKKTVDEPPKTDVAITETVADLQATDEAEPDTAESDASDEAEATQGEIPTNNPTAKPAWIAVALPADGKTAIIDTAGNQLSLPANYEITRIFDVGVVTPPFVSPYFFEYCTHVPSMHSIEDEGRETELCGIISVTGEIVLDLDHEISWHKDNLEGARDLLEDGMPTYEFCHDNSEVLDVTVHKDGRFYFTVNYSGTIPGVGYGDCEPDNFSFVPGRPEWQDIVPSSDECGKRLMDSQGNPIPDSEISKIFENNRVLVRYPRRTQCKSLCRDKAQYFSEDSERCELVSLRDNKKLNKVELKACAGEIADLFPVMPANSDGLWGYMNPQGDLVIPAMFHQAFNFNDGQAIVRLSLDHAKKLCANAQESPTTANKAFMTACAKGFAHWEKAVEVCSANPFDDSLLNDPAVASAALRCMNCYEGPYGTSDCLDNNCWWTRPRRNYNWQFISQVTHRFVNFGWTKINKMGQIMDRFDYSAESILNFFRNEYGEGNSPNLMVSYDSIADQYGYDCISPPLGEVALFTKGDRFGLIDMKMQEIATYDEINTYGFAGWHYNSDCRFIDSQYGLVIVKNAGLYGFINLQGEEIVKTQYNDVVNFRNGFARVRKGDLYGFINLQGEEIVKTQYEDADFFDNGFSQVKKDGLWGLINTKGEEIVKPQYDEKFYIYGSFAQVKKDGLYGYIDTKGKEIVKPQFQKASSKFFANRAVIKQNGKCGYIDIRGNIVVKPQWDECHDFEEASETARVSNMINGNEEISFIHKNGSTVSEAYCLALGYDGNSRALAKTTFVRCRKLGNNLVELGGESRILNDLNPGSPVDIRWEEGPKGEYRLVHANGDPLAPYHLKVRPTKTYTGISAFNFKTKTGNEYLGWIDATGKILWPPSYNDPCAESHGLVVWPKGSCVQ